MKRAAESRRGALDRHRVLDLTSPSSAYCGKLLADLGAEVIRIEPPDAFPDACDGARSPSFLYMNAGKRRLVLDLEQAADRDRFRRLTATADLVLESFAPGHLEQWELGHADFSAQRPELVWTSITGFGRTGPQRAFRSNDLVASALGGAVVAIGDPEDPPVRMAAHQADVVTATLAAASSLAALHHRLRSGRGQLVDVSALETIASITHIAGVGKWLEDGVIPERVGTGLVASVPSGAYPCRDGTIYLMVNRPAHWDALARWIHERTGQEEVLQETFRGPSSNRLPYREFLDLFITELTSQLGVDEAYHEGQRRRIAFTPVQTAAALVSDPQLAARGFFETLDVAPGQRQMWPGAPYRLSKTPCRILRRRPLSPEDEASIGRGAGHAAGRGGEHGAECGAGAGGRQGGSERAVAGREAGGDGALAGLRVVELGTGLAGPWIGRIMAWCGAEVIKVESRAHPDVPRLYVSPREPERGVQPECSPWFTDWNAGKRFVALDLSKEEGAELCRRLIDRSDFVVANYGTGVLERLGLDYARLSERNPELMLLRSTGFGETGPFSRYATWGPNIEALSGLSRFSGFPHRECTTTHFAYPDPLSALHGLVALLAALLHRDRGGSGQAIDLSQLETTIAAIGECLVESFATGDEPARLGNREPDRAPWGCFPCAGDRRWVAITVENDADWARFVEVLGRPDWAREARFATVRGRLEYVDALEAQISDWTRTREDYDVMERCQQAGIAAGVVQNSEDLYRRDPQLAARDFFETIPHFKKGEVVACGIPLGLQGTPGRTTHTGSSVGHDNDLVFREVLGLSAAEIEGLTERGAIEPSGSG